MILEHEMNAAVQRRISLLARKLWCYVAYRYKPHIIRNEIKCPLLNPSIVDHSLQPNKARPSYLCAQSYGYMSPLADETVVFYLKRGSTNPHVRDIRASCYMSCNSYQVAWSAKFTASAQQLRHASHRVKCKSHILVFAPYRVGEEMPFAVFTANSLALC